MNTGVEHIIYNLPSITLKNLAHAEFKSRVDTKFITHMRHIISFLNHVKNDSVVLEVNDSRIFSYRNLYYDDEDFFFFRRHHSGFKNRKKVRIRQYSETGPFFFEIKEKNNKGKTIKHRVSLPRFDCIENDKVPIILKQQTGFSFEQLSNRTHIHYKRITLSNRNLSEKITIDFKLESHQNTHTIMLKNTAIIEVKQIKYSSQSQFIRSLKELKIYPTSFSKYCTSVALLNHSIKKNQFKPVLSKIKKIEHA